MGTNSETSAPRLFAAVLCASASLLLLLSSLYLYAAEARGWGAGLLLIVAVGLLLAAVKSFGRR